MFDILLIGFGVIGTEALSKLVNNYKGKKKLKVAVLDKNINNIPGGIAYSKTQSKFGFFNNPLRLSNPEFIKWIKKKKNIIRIKKFITRNKDFNLTKWLKKNEAFNKIEVNKLNEIYLPRLTYSFFLEEKINDFLKKIKKKNISIDLIESELLALKTEQSYTCILKKNSSSFKFLLTSKKFRLKKTTKKNSLIMAKNIIIGNGLLPPKKIKENIFFNNFNYIWDFYSEGGTQNLLKMIKKMAVSKKLIKILFIGNKAGLLETMPEIEKALKIYIIERRRILNGALRCSSSRTWPRRRSAAARPCGRAQGPLRRSTSSAFSLWGMCAGRRRGPHPNPFSETCDDAARALKQWTTSVDSRRRGQPPKRVAPRPALLPQPWRRPPACRASSTRSCSTSCRAWAVPRCTRTTCA